MCTTRARGSASAQKHRERQREGGGRERAGAHVVIDLAGRTPQSQLVARVVLKIVLDRVCARVSPRACPGLPPAEHEVRIGREQSVVVVQHAQKLLRQRRAGRLVLCEKRCAIAAVNARELVPDDLSKPPVSISHSCQ